MLPTRIFLDLDDVLNRFTMPALEYVGCSVDAVGFNDYNPSWGFDIVRAANALHSHCTFTPGAFWRKLDLSFWATLPESDEMYFLLSGAINLVGTENICILTNPRPEPGCIPGKLAWIRDYLPPWLHDQYLIGKPKHLCAYPEALLIDDCDKNVNAFRKHGGEAILVPRPWNSLHGIDAIEHLHAHFLNLERWKKQQGAA